MPLNPKQIIREFLKNSLVKNRLASAEKALSRFVASLPRNPSAADSEAISRIAELARQAGDAVRGFTEAHGARQNPSDSNRSE